MTLLVLAYLTIFPSLPPWPRHGHLLQSRQVHLGIDSRRVHIPVSQNIGYFFQLVYLVARVMTALGMQRSTRFEAPARNLVTRTLHGLLSCYGWIENRVMPDKLPGSSIMAIARR